MGIIQAAETVWLVGTNVALPVTINGQPIGVTVSNWPAIQTVEGSRRGLTSYLSTATTNIGWNALATLPNGLTLVKLMIGTSVTPVDLAIGLGPSAASPTSVHYVTRNYAFPGHVIIDFFTDGGLTYPNGTRINLFTGAATAYVLTAFLV